MASMSECSDKTHPRERSSSGSLSNVSSLNSTDSMSPHLGTVLVVGGCGFLGHHVVKFLLDEPTCTCIAVMSRRPTINHFKGVAYHIGDITNIEQVRLVLEQVKPNVIINTASPHAYIDHSRVPETFRVNVEGNQNLLTVAAEIGTVKAFIYTSSGPIIAAAGGAYDHADETYPTLAVPVIRKGDPYHVAKAIGDKLVLGANRKNGIRTATVRPTALYGEGDYQNVVPTMQALKDGNTKVWMGYNDIYMDVVYVGHVARLEVLAAKGLLAGITDPNAPKIDGQAFNITDDQPALPLHFFRKYWALAGDKTPLSSVWMIPPMIVLFLANTAEFITWSTSWGKKRPKMLIKERMEFILYTRTYSIKKARELLGFKPWEKQPYTNQEDAIKGSVEWFLLPENHGPVRIGGQHPSWPEFPFRLISNTGVSKMSNIPHDHHCIKNARIMAMTHNSIFRALNAIYQQAPNILPGTQQAADFLSYCSITYDFIHHHQLVEEIIYFPEIEGAAGIPGLMEGNVAQHLKMESGLEKFRKYAESTRKEDYNSEELRRIISGFADTFGQHNHDEIQTILNLHNKIGSKALKTIDAKMWNEAEKQSDIFKISPFVLGCQDKNFILDGEKRAFPELPAIVPYIVHLVLSGRHKSVWRFNPSTLYGTPRPVPTQVSNKTFKTSLVTDVTASNDERLVLPMILGALFLVLIYLFFI